MNVVELSSLKFAPANLTQCKEELKKLRWRKGFVCPACGHDKAYQLKSRNQLECANKKCKRQTSPTAGTQFHNTRTLEGFWAIICEYQNNLTALTKTKIKRLINVSASTARRIANIVCSSFKTANATRSLDAASSSSEEKPCIFQESKGSELDLKAGNTCQQILITGNGCEPRRLFLLIHLQNGIELMHKSHFLISRLII